MALAAYAVAADGVARARSDAPPQPSAATSATAYPCPTYAARPPLRTPSPEQAQTILRQAAQQRQLFAVDATIPYSFVLSLTGYDAIVPPVRRESIQFSVRNARGQAMNGRVHLLETVPQAARLENPCSPFGIFKAGFSFDPAGLAPGRYWLTVSASEDPLMLPDGERVVPQVLPYEFKVYIPSQPESSPALRLGQRFLVFPGSKGRYFDKTGTQIERGQIAFHVATLARIDPNRLLFSVSGTSLRIAMPANVPVTAIPGLPPLVEDPAAADLDRRYAGKHVWGRGQTVAECVVDLPGSNIGGGGAGTSRIPSTIHHVYRVYESTWLRLGADASDRFDPSGDAGTVIDESPLIIWLDIPVLKGTVLPARPAFGQFPEVGPQTCLETYSTFADRWDVERQLSLFAPPASLPKDVRVGMTREEVVWIMGYPPIYGDRAALDSLPVWRYRSGLVSSMSVHFGANGRVTKFGPDN